MRTSKNEKKISSRLRKQIKIFKGLMAMFVSCHPAQIYDCFGWFFFGVCRNMSWYITEAILKRLSANEKKIIRGNFNLKSQNMRVSFVKR